MRKFGNPEFAIKYTHFYNLDLIISVGYRVKSPQGTVFCQWVTEKLSRYITKGFLLDVERLKNPDLPFDYFEELERTISDIRTSEKRFYRKITDIYAQVLIMIRLIIVVFYFSKQFKIKFIMQ